MGRLTRDGTAELVSRDQILRHERGQENNHFSCSADHVEDWQPYPVDPYSCSMCDHTFTQLFPQKAPGSRLLFSRTGVQPSPGSSTIELPSAFTESGAYPPDRALPGSPRQCSLPLARRHTSRRAPNWSSEEAYTWEHHPQPTIPPPRLNRQAKSRR